MAIREQIYVTLHLNSHGLFIKRVVKLDGKIGKRKKLRCWSFKLYTYKIDRCREVKTLTQPSAPYIYALVAIATVLTKIMLAEGTRLDLQGTKGAFLLNRRAIH